MAENDVVDSVQADGAGENQTSVSQPKTNSIPGATNPQDFVSRKDFDNVVKELRGLQSRQDKDKSEQTRFMDELKQHMAKGLSLDEAEQAVNASNETRKKDELLYRMAEKLGVSDSPSGNSTTGNGGNQTDKVAQVFEQFGISPSDPQAARLFTLSGETLWQEAGKYALSLKQGSKPDSSESTSLNSETSKQDASIDKLTSEYKQKMMEARGKRDLLSAIREDYKKKGVDVYNVSF